MERTFWSMPARARLDPPPLSPASNVSNALAAIGAVGRSASFRPSSLQASRPSAA